MKNPNSEEAAMTQNLCGRIEQLKKGSYNIEVTFVNNVNGSTYFDRMAKGQISRLEVPAQNIGAWALTQCTKLGPCMLYWIQVGEVPLERTVGPTLVGPCPRPWAPSAYEVTVGYGSTSVGPTVDTPITWISQEFMMVL